MPNDLIHRERRSSVSTDLEDRNNPFENPSVSLGNLGAIWSWISGTEPTASGEVIDEHVALQVITVYSCVRLIAETASSLPLKLYERRNKGREEALDNYLYDLLTLEPNPEMGAVPFWETTVGCMALCGNSYVYIQRVGGKVVGLWPLNPKKTRPYRMPNGELAYQCFEGMNNGEVRIYNNDDILHFKLFGWDGLLGLSPIMLARQGLGLTRAAEKMGARLFANNGRPSGIMTTAGKLDEKALINTRESWQAAQTGDNALKTAFLPGDWKYTPMSLDMEDIEFLKTRVHQRSEIAALFHVPAHLVGDTTRQSNTNSEQEGLNLVTFCLRPYLTRIENEIQRKLLPGVGRNANKYFVQFDVRELLRGDFKTTMDGYAVGRQWGFFNANEIREELGENPIGKIGDVYMVPVNFRNAEDLLLDPEPKDEESFTPGVIDTDPTPDATATPEAAPEKPDTTDSKADGTTSQERSIVQGAASLTTVFRDAMGRLLHRDSRTLETVTSIFEPVLRSITALSVDHAARQNQIVWDNEQAETKIVGDMLKGIAKRSEDWQAGNADELAGEEFRKVLRGIVSAVYREVGAAMVPGNK